MTRNPCGVYSLLHNLLFENIKAIDTNVFPFFPPSKETCNFSQPHPRLTLKGRRAQCTTCIRIFYEPHQVFEIIF